VDQESDFILICCPTGSLQFQRQRLIEGKSHAWLWKLVGKVEE
jgi:hypothetical protein